MSGYSWVSQTNTVGHCLPESVWWGDREGKEKFPIPTSLMGLKSRWSSNTTLATPIYRDLHADPHTWLVVSMGETVICLKGELWQGYHWLMPLIGEALGWSCSKATLIMTIRREGPHLFLLSCASKALLPAWLLLHGQVLLLTTGAGWGCCMTVVGGRSCVVCCIFLLCFLLYFCSRFLVCAFAFFFPSVSF